MGAGDVHVPEQIEAQHVAHDAFGFGGGLHFVAGAAGGAQAAFVGAGSVQGFEEVEFVLGRGAKMVLVRPAPVPGLVKPRSLGDPLHDPVWARVAEAGVPVGFHLSDSGYLAIAALWGGNFLRVMRQAESFAS